MTTLSFENGLASGSAGCNADRAEHSIQAGNGIAFGQAAQKLEECNEPEGVMEQEEQNLRT